MLVPLAGESHADALERMDEEQLKDLQKRLRTAREKNFSKVEVFDEALARLNQRLDSVRDTE